MSIRVSYPREMRARAELEEKGLATIDVIDADGARSTTQGPAGETEIKFLRWAAVWVMRRDEVPLPDLERMLKSRLKRLEVKS